MPFFHSLLSLILPVFVAMICSGCTLFEREESLPPTALDLMRAHKYVEAEALLRQEIVEHEKKIIAGKAGVYTDSSAKKKADEERKKEAKRLATAYKNLATVLFETGKYQLAEPAFLRSIEIYSEYFGRDNEYVANGLHSIAAAYYKQGKIDEAQRYYKDELSVLQSQKSPNALKLAITANNLAAIYQRLGEDAEAEKYFSWALNLCANFKSSEKESDQMVDILNNLALFYEKEGNYTQALHMVDRALATEDKRTKGFSENRVRSLLVRAVIEKSTFDLEASEEDYQTIIALIEKSKLKRSELACEALDKYADLLLLQRKFKEAEPQFENCIKACEAAHGNEHPSVAERLSDFAVLYRRTQRYAEAEKLLRRSLAIEENTLGVDTPRYLTTLHRLASVLADEKNFEEADKLYQAELPKLKQKIGEDHPFVADTIDNWAEFVEHSKGKSAAEELRSSARTMRLKLSNTPLSPVGPLRR